MEPIWWMDLANNPLLHRCDTSGNVLPDLPILGMPSISSGTYDASRNLLWGATADLGGGARDIYQIDLTTGIAVFQFTLIADGAFFTDGIAYDGQDDSLWISGDVSTNIFHYTTGGALIAGPIPIPNLPPNGFGGLCGNSGIAAGVNELYLGFNGCTVVQVYDKNLNFIEQYDLDQNRTEDMECDNVTFTAQGVDAIWTKDAFDPEIIAFAVPLGTCPTGGTEPAIEKFYTKTNNNWDLRCDDPNATVVGDRCELSDGTDVGPARQANINDDDVFADNLDQNGAGAYVLLGKENPKKTVVTPGQYIAVSNVFVPFEQTIWVEEDFSDCLDIGHVNPNKVPGGVQVVLVLNNGDVIDIDDDLALGIGGSIDLGDTSATVHVEDVPAEATVRVMLKFGPNHEPDMVGLQCTNVERLLGEDGQIAEASAVLVIEAK
jgi:hypothetical protein